MAGIDSILQASVDAVKKSGALEAGALMATVSAVNADGTITAQRAADTYPRVRLLSAYYNPVVGHQVEILKTAGGWVCLGHLATAGPAAWTALTLVSPWTNWTGTTLQVKAMPDGTALLSGRVTGNSSVTSSNNTITNLPDGVRPIQNQYLTTLTGTNKAAQLAVYPSGVIQVWNYTTPVDFVQLDGLRWPIA